MKSDVFEEIKEEVNALDQSVALNKIVVEVLQLKRKEIFNFWIAFGVVVVVFIVAITGLMLDNIKNRDRLMDEMAVMREDFTHSLAEERQAWIDYIETLETTVTTETTTTQNVEGDNSGIVNGNQYNDNATHNGGAE